MNLPEQPNLRPSLFFAIAFVFLAIGLGMRSPWPADEPRFALIARDMVETGDWFFPRVGGEIYQDKPPVFFWLIASMLTVTGSLRFAFLLPSLFAAMGVLWLVHDLGRRWWNPRTGLLASAALLATIQFVLQAKRAQIDMTLCFFTTLALYGLARHLREGPGWGWYLTGFAAMGAGVITKGVGFLPVFILIPFAWATWKNWPAVTRSRSWLWIAGPVAMLAVIGAWLLPMLSIVSGSADPALASYRDEILFAQTAGRYANPWHHIKPFWYFLVEVIPPLWLPLSIALPWLVPRWWKEVRNRDLRTMLLVGWSLLALTFFSLSPGKRGVYILVILPAAALAAGPWIDELWEKRWIHRVAFGITALITALLLAATALNVFAPPEEALRTSAELEIALTPPLLVFGIAGALSLVLFRIRRGVAGLVLFTSSLWIVTSLWLAPSIDDARSGRAIVKAIEAASTRDAELGLVHWKEQFLLYLDRPITHFGHRRHDSEEETLDAVGWLQASPGRQLVVDEPAMEQCFKGGTVIGDAHGTRWYLVKKENSRQECVQPVRDILTFEYVPPGLDREGEAAHRSDLPPTEASRSLHSPRTPAG